MRLSKTLPIFDNAPLERRLSMAETAITQTSKEIALKASQYDMNLVNGRVTSLAGELSVQAGLIQSKVSQDGIMSAIVQTPENIKIAANKIQITGEDGVVNAINDSQVSISADRINFTGSSVKISANNIDLDGEDVVGLINGQPVESRVKINADLLDFEGSSIRLTANNIAMTGQQFVNRINSQDPETKVSISADYINLTGHTTITDIRNDIAEHAILIQANADGLLSKVSKDDVESIIEQNASSIRLKASAISWTSTNSSMTAEGILTCNGAVINGELYNTSNYHSSWGGGADFLLKSELKSNKHTFYCDDVICGLLTNNAEDLPGGVSHNNAPVLWNVTPSRPLLLYGGTDVNIGTLYNSDRVAKTNITSAINISFSASSQKYYMNTACDIKANCYTFDGAYSIGFFRAGDELDAICGANSFYPASSRHLYVDSYVRTTHGFSLSGTSGISIENLGVFTETVSNTTSLSLKTSSDNIVYVNTYQKVQLQSTSSKRFKHNIRTLKSKELDPHRLLMLKPKQFVYNRDASLQYKDMEGKTLPGFIAEDVAAIYPSAVIRDADGNVESWDERRVIPGMLSLIQELYTKIQRLEEILYG